MGKSKNKTKEILTNLFMTIGELPCTFTDLILIGILWFGAIIVSTPNYEKVYGVWSKPIPTAVAIVLIYYIIVRIASLCFPNYHNKNAIIGGVTSKGASLFVARAKKAITLSKDDHRRCAIHEAGHLISMSLFEKPPKILTTWVKPFENFPQGNVYYEFDNLLKNKNYFETSMFLFLAGGCAEKILLDTFVSGSRTDHEKWENTAKQYLSSFDHDYSWFSLPQNEAEASLNASTLKKMREEQLEKVTEFIRLNEELVFSIANTLMSSEEIETEQGLNLLQEVEVNYGNEIRT